MLLIGLTPFRYLYLYAYILILLFILSVKNLYLYWLLIEVFVLLFIAVAYSIKIKSPSCLMLYFIVQTLSSFGLLLRIFFSPALARVFLLVKIAMFPFMAWFIKALSSFPPLLLLLRITFNKLPVLLLIPTFELLLDWDVVFFFSIISLMLGRVLIVLTLKIPLILIYSSIRNNIWFFIREELNTHFLLVFLRVYALSLWILLAHFNPITYKMSKSAVRFLALMNLARVPLLPMFWVKLLLVYFLAQSYNPIRLIALVLFLRVISTLGYLTPAIKFILYKNYWV